MDPNPLIDPNEYPYPSIEQLMREQGTGQPADPDQFFVNIWPEDEAVDGFLHALDERRERDRSDRAA